MPASNPSRFEALGTLVLRHCDGIDATCHTPLLKKLNRARNDLSGKVIPLFKTYQDWEKKIIFEPFDQENLAGQPTILVRLN